MITILLAASAAAAQESVQPAAAQLQEMRQAIGALQAQLAEARREADALRQKVDAMQGQLTALQRGDAAAADQDLVAAKVQEQEQTKVASGSKYRMRLSGFVLVNVFATRGAIDNLDLPQAAVPVTSGGAFGGSVRQSNVSLEVFGAELAGARTSGDLSFDFFGGFPITSQGVTEPLMRLRTAKLSLDWTHASIVAGQDTPFFSPRSPSSLASTAYPALSSAGNLWTWTPQVRVERRAGLGGSTLSLQAGILDPLTGELPPDEYNRAASAGERSGAPAEAVRIGVQRGIGDRTLDVGGGAYYSRQSWLGGSAVNAWAATADWDVPLGTVLALSGELYHGQAIAGLGGGVSAAVVVSGGGGIPLTASAVRTTGGWLQLTAAVRPRLSFNAAYGLDNPSRGRIAGRQSLVLLDPRIVSRNASAFVNAIYQARSNFLMSVEYRRLWTEGLDAVTRRGHHVSFSTGIGF